MPDPTHASIVTRLAALCGGWPDNVTAEWVAAAEQHCPRVDVLAAAVDRFALRVHDYDPLVFSQLWESYRSECWRRDRAAVRSPVPPADGDYRRRIRAKIDAAKAAYAATAPPRLVDIDDAVAV